MHKTNYFNELNPSLLTIMETMDFSNRSKQHANKNHKNQQIQKSLLQQQDIQTTQTLPKTSTSTTSTSPIPDTTEFNSFVPRNLNNVIRTSPTLRTHSQNQPKTTTVEIQKSVELEASSLQSLEDVETISDESQNIQVTHEHDQYATTQKHKNINYANIEGFATSPRGNLLPENLEKPYRGKSSQELDKIYQLSKEKEDNYGKSAEYKTSDNTREQRKRLQTFILSDVTPQSFQPSSNIRGSEDDTDADTDTSVEFVSSSSSSSTTQRYVPVTDPKPFQYSLQTGANGFSLRAENFPLSSSINSDNEEENDLPLYRRPQLPLKASKSTSSTENPSPSTTLSATRTTIPTSSFKKTATKTLDVFDAEELTPTTYSPPQRLWRTARPTSKSLKDFNSPIVDAVNFEKPIRSTTVTINPSSKSVMGTTERSIQSFTARATVFKDNLTKTTGPPAHRFVSPYKSLETILSEKEERFGVNNLRTTSKPRYTSSASTPTPFVTPTTKQPLRSYFLITSTPRTLNDVIGIMSTSPRNFSISDAILSTLSTTGFLADTTTEKTEPTIKVLKSTTPLTTTTTTESTTIPTQENLTYTKQRDSSSQEVGRPRGRSRYTVMTQTPYLNTDDPTTYAPKFRFAAHTEEPTNAPSLKHYRRKVQRARIPTNSYQRLVNNIGKSREKYQSFKELTQQHESQNQVSKALNRKPIENETTDSGGPRAEALIGFGIDNKQDNSIDDSRLENTPVSDSSSTEQVVSITDRPHKYFYSNKYRQLTAEHNLAEGLQNAGYITSSTSRSRFRPKSVLEQLQLFLAGESDESESAQQIEDFTQPEIKAAVEEIKNLYTSTTTTTTLRPTTTASPPTIAYIASSTTTTPHNTSPIAQITTTRYHTATSTLSHLPRYSTASYGGNTNSTSYHSSSNNSTTVSAAIATTKSSLLMPMRASRVNNAIKSSIAAAAASSSSNSQAPASATTIGLRNHKVINGLSSSSSSSSSGSNSNVAAATFKCSDSTSNAKCNEIPSRYLNKKKTKTKTNQLLIETSHGPYFNGFKIKAQLPTN